MRIKLLQLKLLLDFRDDEGHQQKDESTRTQMIWGFLSSESSWKGTSPSPAAPVVCLFAAFSDLLCRKRGGGYVLLTEWNWFNTLWPKPFLNRSVFPKRPQRAFWWPTNRFPCSKFILTQHHHYEGWAAITEQKNCSVFRRTERCSEEQLCVQRNRAVFRRTDQFSEDSSVFRRTALFRRTGLCSEEASHTQKNSSLFRRTGLCWEEQTGVQNNASWTIFFATRRKSMN